MLEDRHSGARAVLLPQRTDAAEANDGRPSRFVRRHAGAQVVVDVQLQVALDLAIEIVRASSGEEGAGEPRHPDTKPSHGVLGEKKRAMMPAVRCHSRASRSSCFRPARVSV